MSGGLLGVKSRTKIERKHRLVKKETVKQEKVCEMCYEYEMN